MNIKMFIFGVTVVLYYLMRLVSREIGILCRIFGQIQQILPSGYINFPSCPSVLKSLVPELLVDTKMAQYIFKRKHGSDAFFNQTSI